MTDAGFFKGTSADQDARFADKKKKLLRTMKFSDNLNTKIDMNRVNLESIRPWITARITELLGFEDEVVCDYVFNQLESQYPNPKEIQMNITGFLNGKNARIFLTELWDLLLSAMKTPSGIPQCTQPEETQRKQSPDLTSKERSRVSESNAGSKRDHKTYDRYSGKDRTPRRRSYSSSRSNSPESRRREKPIPVVNSKDLIAARDRNNHRYPSSPESSSRDYRSKRSSRRSHKKRESSYDRYRKSHRYRDPSESSQDSRGSNGYRRQEYDRPKKMHSKDYGDRGRDYETRHEQMSKNSRNSSKKKAEKRRQSTVSDDSSSSNEASSSHSRSDSQSRVAYYGPPVLKEKSNRSNNSNSPRRMEFHREYSSEQSSGTEDSDSDSDSPSDDSLSDHDRAKRNKRSYESSNGRTASKNSEESELRRRALASMVQQKK